MSKRNAKQKQAHLVFSATTGFQYYLTLPKHLSTDARLPAQIRWSVGRDESLARALGRLLDRSFAFLYNPGHETLSVALVQRRLEDSHALIRRFLDDADQAWAILPSPAQLAKENLETGLARLNSDSQHRSVLFSQAPGSEIIFSLSPSQSLQDALKLTFSRLDWPLGTHDQAVAREAAAYIYVAIEQLEQLESDMDNHGANRGSFTALALYEYLLHARPDKGAALSPLPAELPSSMAAYAVHHVLDRLTWPKAKLSAFRVHQQPDGLYAIELLPCELTRMLPLLQRKTCVVPLPTNSAIIAALVAERLLPAIESRLKSRLSPDQSDDAYERAMSDIGDLLRRSLGPKLQNDPLAPTPVLANTESVSAGTALRDPATLALASALGSLLPDSQRVRLEQLMSGNSTAGFILPTDVPPSSSITFGELTRKFEAEQLKQGSWSRPRTRAMVSSRLVALDELVGAHRRLDSLTRMDFITLRDQIRQYPKNRQKIASARRQSLHKLISEGKHEAINPRTAKKFFELARAVMRYAHDHGLLQENLAAGLTFVTRGAEAPRRRTYDHDQLHLLLNGPVYSLETAPRWRLDDYKFWMPLLGLYTGARLGELCQLRIADIKQDEGVWVINIDDAGMKQIKTLSSRRSVPLHRSLIDAGFLSFVRKRESVSQNRQAQLFDGVKIYPTLAASHTASKWFAGGNIAHNGYLGQCGLAKDALTFHGLRHSFINQFRRQKLDLQIGMALVGHLDKSTTGGYGDSYPSSVLKEELDKIDFNLSLDHIAYSHYEQLQQTQGQRQIGRPSTRRT